MNKGFSLVELLAVIVILALIMGIGVVSYTSITKKSESDYYDNLIDNLELGATNYFVDNRSQRPGYDSAGNITKCAQVSLKMLIDKNYVESATDSKGNDCDLNNSFAYIIRNSNNQYEYEVKLICNDFKYNETYVCD